VQAIFEKRFPSQKAAIPSDPNVNYVTVRDESMVRTPPNQDLSAKSDSIFNVGEEKYFQGMMNKRSEWGNHLCMDDVKWMMNETLREDLGEDCQTCYGGGGMCWARWCASWVSCFYLRQRLITESIGLAFASSVTWW
jgi:hypothetical protein